MKRKIKTGNKITIMLTVVALCLCGCTQEGTIQKEETAIQESIPAVEQEESTVQDDTESSDIQMEYDVQKALEEAESKASDMQKKLQEDASLTQTDMNMLSYEIYQVWDDLLNELWGHLKTTLDDETMESLLEEQRAWITQKEEEVKQATEAFFGGSLVPLVANQKAAELTKERVYELAAYFEVEGE